MQFKQLTELMKAQFDEMQSQGELFISSVSGQQVCDTYLAGFEKQEIFRDPASSVNHCNHCSNFIRRYGNIVTIRDNKIVTMFDIVGDLGEDQNSIDNCSKLLKESTIVNYFFEHYEELNSLPYEKTNKKQEKYRLGVASNLKQYSNDESLKFGKVNTSTVYTFNHFHCDVNKKNVIFTAQSKEAVLGEKKVTHQLFKKTLNIPLDTLELVRDLINQGSLLRGDMYLDKVLNIIQIKTEYDSLKLSTQEKDIWIWNILSAVKYPKFANELIGTLCVELAEDKELNEACLDYNKRADPANYAQAKSAVTPKMRQEAEKQIEELGFTESFDKKFATIEDIDVSENGPL